MPINENQIDNETASTPGVTAPTVSPASTPTTTTLSATPTDDGAITYQAPTAPTISPRDVAADETVESRLTGLLQKKSPYLDVARQGALETAAGRGLQSTSIAAGAGERAAIEAALPIAQQDAATYGTAAQSAQEARQTTQLEGYRGGISAGLTAEETQAQIKINAEQEAAVNKREDQEMYAQLSSGIQQEYQDAYLAIQTTADTIMDEGAKMAAIDALNTSTQSQVDMLSALYNVDITWSGGLSTFTGTVLTETGTPTETTSTSTVAAEEAAAAAREFTIGAPSYDIGGGNTFTQLPGYGGAIYQSSENGYTYYQDPATGAFTMYSPVGEDSF
jgi:hypothetical protein